MRPAFSIALVVSLLACDPFKDDDMIGDNTPTDTGTDTGTNTGALDEDGDGYPADQDCDDDDASVHPDATELCNGIDDDCDGATDEDDAADATTWYADADGDGQGDAANTAAACTEPTGMVDNDLDCDDTNADVHTEATELCNGIDDDCDGTTDEDDADDVLTWYVDADGDGQGDATNTAAACTEPTGMVDNDLDCDDTNANVFDGATEHCNGIDDDCDGATDEDDAADATTWYVDTDGDGYGASTSVVSCEVPTGYAATDGDCDDDDANLNPGEAEICNGIDDDCDGTVDNGLATSTSYADSDGDGYGDDTVSVTDCAVPSGYLGVAGDCDDADASINPDAEEVCDSIDNDCDGLTDDDDSDVLDQQTWYTDDDADGYGDATSSALACDQPSNMVSNDTDCDDTDAGAFPSETETCDGVDNDCDGDVDNGVLGTDSACPAEDCTEILADDPTATDDWYTLDAGTYYCDMSTDGGGWTLVQDDAYVYGTAYDTSYYNSEAFTWSEVLFQYASGSVSAHCTYPSSLTACNNIGFQFDTEDWGVALNWGSSVCGMSTSDYTGATSYIGGYDFVISRTESTDTIRAGTLEGISNCTTSDNYGAAYIDIYVRR